VRIVSTLLSSTLVDCVNCKHYVSWEPVSVGKLADYVGFCEVLRKRLTERKTNCSLFKERVWKKIYKQSKFRF